MVATMRVVGIGGIIHEALFKDLDRSAVVGGFVALLAAADRIEKSRRDREKS